MLRFVVRGAAMKNKLRIAIIGSGMMGVQHAEAIRRVPGTEIVALADPNLALAEKICLELCIPKAYADYQQMLRSEQLDAVHICTPNSTHFAIAKDAIEAGLHVYCEKPLAISAEETSELCRLAKAHGVEAGVNFVYRQNVIVRDMYERVHAESWGNTFLIRGEYIQDWMLYDTDYNWRCIPALNGPSRAVADIGSHWFDAVQYITGQKIAKVYAKLITAHPQRKKFTHQAKTFEAQTGSDYTLVDIDSEDAAYILFELEDGTPGVLTVSQVSAGYKNGMKISLDGSRYSMTWGQENPDKLMIGTREGGKEMIYAAAGNMHGHANLYTTLPGGHAVGWADALKNGVNMFYRRIQSGTEAHFATFEDGDNILRIVDACLASSRTNAWVTVERMDQK